MVNVLSSSVVDRGFIGGVMVNVLSSSVVDHRWCNGQRSLLECGRSWWCNGQRSLLECGRSSVV